jgi:hypothetical protein
MQGCTSPCPNEFSSILCCCGKCHLKMCLYECKAVQILSLRSCQPLHRLSLKPNLCWSCFILCVLITSHWKTEYCFLRARLACKCIGCGFVGSNNNHCQWILECYLWLVNLTESTLSCLNTQWGFNDTTPVEGRWWICLWRNIDRRALYVSKLTP